MLHDEEGSCLEASRLDEVQRPCDLSETQVQPATVPPEVRDAMLATIPSLRAFALSLTNNRDAADDLVQDTILRAWKNIEKFAPGTNLQAWLFTILRNGFYSTYRKRQREVADPDGSYAGRLRTAPEQTTKCDFQDMLRALARLSPEHRGALLLIVAEGLSYEEAARVCGVPVGTVKSRVNRARAGLARLLALHEGEDLGPDQVTQAALQTAI
jgi:RNA polymerase sigma-70 factor, ECF subfamily